MPCGHTWTGSGRASLFGVNDAAAACIQRGGEVRTIVDISYPIIDNIRQIFVSIGEEVYHIDQLGMTFMVTDRKYSLTALDLPARASLSAPMAALWTDDPAFAQFLAATREMLRKQAVPAEERIQELLTQGPPSDME